MAKIILNNEEYDLESLSPSAKAQLQAIQFSQAEINRMQMTIAALETAKKAYTNALASILESKENASDDLQLELPDSITFD